MSPSALRPRPVDVPPSPGARRGRRRRAAAALFAVLAAVGTVLLGGVLTAAPARADVPYCGIWWGSLPKVDAGSSMATISGIRSGRHDCYDRLVVDVAGAVAGYDVRYVAQVHAEGSGAIVPVRGVAALAVVVRATSYDPLTGRATYVPRVPSELTDVAGFRTFRQVAWGGSVEGQSTIALGVRARLPFRVFILPGPGQGSRLVVDVAHRW